MVKQCEVDRNPGGEYQSWMGISSYKTTAHFIPFRQWAHTISISCIMDHRSCFLLYMHKNINKNNNIRIFHLTKKLFPFGFRSFHCWMVLVVSVVYSMTHIRTEDYSLTEFLKTLTEKKELKLFPMELHATNKEAKQRTHNTTFYVKYWMPKSSLQLFIRQWNNVRNCHTLFRIEKFSFGFVCLCPMLNAFSLL